ncbi:MAG: hypothetical protein OXI94_11765 [Gemmatimonadota bacterium]|nr:hypothetical protein [Gemmatimonadota bacterium]MDE2953121.1 hypothetical protein [Gemmatimonadota bacterium]
MNMPTFESRVATLEAIQAQINERLNSIDNRLNGIENRQDNRFNSMDNRLTGIEIRINSNFKWIMGLLITVLLANIGTAITIVLTLAKP